MSIKNFLNDFEAFLKFFSGKSDANNGKTKNLPFLLLFAALAALVFFSGKISSDLVFYCGIGLFVWILYGAIFGEKSAFKGVSKGGGAKGNPLPSNTIASASTPIASNTAGGGSPVNPRPAATLPTPSPNQAGDSQKNALNKALARRDGKKSGDAETQSSSNVTHSKLSPSAPMSNRR